MINNTFIPNWYIDKKNKSKIKKIKICVMVLLIINIILLVGIVNMINKRSNLDKKTISQQKRGDIVMTTKHDTIILEKYNIINNFFIGNNLNYKDITITDNNFEINIEVKDYVEYIKAISCIENKYIIKKLIPNIKDKGKFNFNIILETKDV